MIAAARRPRSILPGFGLTLGLTVAYLSLIVLIPLAAAFFKASTLGWFGFWHDVTTARAMASYEITFGASFVAACINLVMGVLTAWVLVRYQFPLKKLFDSLVDLPFALPTAVAGIALSTHLRAERTGFGKPLLRVRHSCRVFAHRHRHRADVHRLAVHRAHRAAGAGRPRSRTRRSGGQPGRQPLANVFARSAAGDFAGRDHRLRAWLSRARIGEYGSVIFIAGNMPMRTEITPLLIVTKLEQYDYAGATAIAVAMLVVSFVMLLRDQSVAEVE